MERIPRAEVPEEQKWNSKALFAGWDEVEAEIEALEAETPKLAEFKGRFAEGADVVAEYFDLYQETLKRMYFVSKYVTMSMQVDTGDEKAKSVYPNMSKLGVMLLTITAYAQPEMVGMVDTLLEWAESEENLAIYKRYFDYLKQQANHTRSAEVEEILGMLSSPFQGTMNLWRDLLNTDLVREDITVAEGETKPYQQLASMINDNPDRNIRKQLYENQYEACFAYKNTIINNYLTSVKQSTFMAKARGYESVEQMRLAPAGVSTKVLDNLLDAFTENMDTWHRYWDVKRRRLGYEELHPYDIWAPVVDEPPDVSYEQTIDWLCESLAPLGDDYIAVLRKACLEDGWVDRAHNVGKANTAFSTPSLVGEPPFLMVHYDHSVSSMSILAHELGHSMNHYLIGQNQPVIYNSLTEMASSTIAETHSNFYQAMLRAHLRKVKGDDEQFMIAMIDEAMFNFHRYFFLMPSLVRFEREIHNRVMDGKPVSAQIAMDIMSGFMAEGYGDTMTFNPDYEGIVWAPLPHPNMPFYSFQYAIGISAAHAIADNILAGKDGAAENYKQFASLGTSMDAMSSFTMAGVDMTKRDSIDKAFKILAGFVDQLEELV